MQETHKIRHTFMLMTSSGLLAAIFGGCNLFGGGLEPLPTGQISAVQLFEQPDFTVALSVESAVIDSASTTKVNWVFGDGSGFVEGAANRTTITHRYMAPGTFEVRTFLFDATGVVDQVVDTITVASNGDGGGPGPTPVPENLPGTISGSLPFDGATNVDIKTMLSWSAGLDADSHDVYLGTVADDVDNADTSTAAIFRGNQTDSQFDPAGLTPDTNYFWRIDEVNALGTTKGTVFSFTTAAATEMAKTPGPANGSTSARADQILTWVAGTGAASHDVFFGTDAMAVTDATTDDADIFQGNQTAASFDPEDAAAAITGQLLANTQYFWRIDEVGPGGTATGDVWNFTTQASPPKITSSVPADLASNVAINQVLSWTASSSVESFDVYFGVDSIDVGSATRDSTEFRGNQTGTNFDPSALVISGATFYWRIDTLGPGGTTTGDVLSFTTAAPPGQVVGPFTPADNATNVIIDAILSWGVGAGMTTGFDVYLSNNSNAVVNGNASALQGNQDVSLTTFDPMGILQPGTEFFWRIDAVGPGGTTTGTVMSFTIGNVPNQVETPDPANSATGVALDVTLTWMAAVGATSYDVYFDDTSLQTVQNATTNDTVFRGNVTAASFMPGSIFPAGLLEGNTQYFWRIDAVGPGGTTTGTVWSFTTGPPQVTVPVPANMDLGVDVNTSLSWTASTSATSYDVYLGTDMTLVQAADNTDATGLFLGNVAVTNFDPMTLMPATLYYWRVDAVDDTGTGSTTKGELWQFTTGAGQATAPMPADGASGASLTPVLGWTAAADATSQDIYFGTNQTTVQNADRNNTSVFKGTFPVTGGPPPFSPGNLNGMTAYFWRVDSVTTDGTTIFTTTGKVWQFITGPDKATAPSPANFAMDVSLTTLLQWTAGNGAVSHDVYLITETANAALPTAQQIAVAGNMTSPPFVTNVAITTFDPGSLAADTVYLWRIDEVAADGTTITQGDIWRFTTLVPGKASAPSPANFATDISLTKLLQWTAGNDAAGHDVYLITETANTALPTAQQIAVADTTSAAFMGNQGLTTFDPGLLTANTVYLWRIDEVAADGTTRTMGDVWRFTTLGLPQQAGSPSPLNGATAVSITTTLNWAAATEATSYDVFFGTNMASPAPQGNQTGLTFNPGTLALNTTYYWRIDAVNDAGTTTGVVWSFTTTP